MDPRVACTAASAAIGNMRGRKFLNRFHWGLLSFREPSARTTIRAVVLSRDRSGAAKGDRDECLRGATFEQKQH